MGNKKNRMRYIYIIIILLAPLFSYSQNNVYENAISYLTTDDKLIKQLRFLTNRLVISKELLKNDTLQCSVSNEIIKLSSLPPNEKVIDEFCKIKKRFYSQMFYKQNLSLSSDSTSRLRVYYTSIFYNKYIAGQIVIIRKKSKYHGYTTSPFKKSKRINFLIEFEGTKIKNIYYKNVQYSTMSMLSFTLAQPPDLPCEIYAKLPDIRKVKQ